MLTLALLLALAQNKPTLVLDGPDPGKPDEYQKAAQAIEARLKAYGFPDVTATSTTLPKVGKGAGRGLAIELKTKDGFSPAMVETIKKDFLNNFVGRCDSAAAFYQPTKAEEDLYVRKVVPPDEMKKLSTWKAPEGVVWWTFDGGKSAQMIYKGGVFNSMELKNEPFMTKEGKPKARIRLSPAGAKHFDALTQAAKDATYDFYSGRDNIKSGKWIAGEVDGEKIIYVEIPLKDNEEICVKNPLPFFLSMR